VIGVGRPGVLDPEALAKAAAAKKIAGAAVDLAERTSEKDPLRGLANVTITEHAANSPEANERRWRLVRENVRRFAAGEPLLCVVER
jgi:phosphoglycerate dehydrogenase-like enzyme